MPAPFKFILITWLVLAAFAANAQKYVRLRALEPFDTPKKVHGIMYGNFVQRLGWSSGGYPQDITILNIDSNKLYTFQVKKTFKSAKENTFCYYIAPGNYVILSYLYSRSGWGLITQYSEPINKGKTDTAQIASNDSPDYLLADKFRFTILPASVTYVGTWDLSERPATFRDENDEITPVLQRKFKKFDFSASRTSVPE